MRYVIFVQDGDGSPRRGSVVGPYRSEEAAREKADAIYRADERLERTSGMYGPTYGAVACIVFPLTPGTAGAGDIVRAVFDEV